MATQFPKIPESATTLTLSPAPLAGIFIREASGKTAVNETAVVGTLRSPTDRSHAQQVQGWKHQHCNAFSF